MRAVLAGLALVVTVLVAAPAEAAQPYGGCDEAYAYARSAGAQECREAGWTIRPRLVVGPHGYVHMSALPHCRNEDGSGQRSACSWNFRRSGKDGNGIGRMLWIDGHDHVHYVKGWAH